MTFAPRTVASLPALLKVTEQRVHHAVDDRSERDRIAKRLELSCAANTLHAGARSDTCTVNLTGSAAGNPSIHLESNNAAVRVPSLVTVANGSSSASFAAVATWVPTAQKAAITAIEDRISASIQIQLTAATASVSAQPAPLVFDDVAIGSTDAQSLSLVSYGTEPITIDGIVVTGAGITVTGFTPPLTLNPGNGIDAYVGFAPIAGGLVNGSITIFITASNGQALNLPVNGAGVAHQASLRWTSPQTNDPIAGYNIFRAEAGSTSYVQVNADLVTGIAYMDQTVVNGTVYIYYIETVDESGVSSTPSAAFPFQIQ